MEYTIENFGKKMRDFRGARSLREIAEISGIHKSAISKAEKGKSLLGTTARQLAAAYGVPEAELEQIQTMWKDFAENRHRRNLRERQHAKQMKSCAPTEGHHFISHKPWSEMA